MNADQSEMNIRRAITADVETLFDIRLAAVENRTTREELAANGVTPEAISALLDGERAAAFLAIKGDQALRAAPH